MYSSDRIVAANHVALPAGMISYIRHYVMHIKFVKIIGIFPTHFLAEFLSFAAGKIFSVIFTNMQFLT